MKNPTLTRPNAEVRAAFEKLANETNMKFNLDSSAKLTGDDVLRIVESQFQIIPDAVQAGEGVKLAYIGKFALRK